MDIIALLGLLQSKISELQTQLSDTEAALANIAKENYDKGFEDGKKSMGEPGDKLYSQEEVNAITAPLNEKLVSLQSELSDLKASIDGKVAAAAAAAVVSFKSGLKAKYAEQQSKEALEEKAFGDMLDEVEVEAPAEEPVKEEPAEEIPVEVPTEEPAEEDSEEPTEEDSEESEDDSEEPIEAPKE